MWKKNKLKCQMTKTSLPLNDSKVTIDLDRSHHHRVLLKIQVKLTKPVKFRYPQFTASIKCDTTVVKVIIITFGRIYPELNHYGPYRQIPAQFHETKPIYACGSEMIHIRYILILTAFQSLFVKTDRPITTHH